MCKPMHWIVVSVTSAHLNVQSLRVLPYVCTYHTDIVMAVMLEGAATPLVVKATFWSSHLLVKPHSVLACIYLTKRRKTRNMELGT